MYWSAISLAAALTLSSPAPEVSAPQVGSLNEAVALVDDERDFQAATEIIESLQEMWPDDQGVAYLHGRVLYFQEDYQGACGVFERLVDQHPDDDMYALWLCKSYSQIVKESSYRGEGPLSLIGPGRAGRRALERALELNPDNLAAQVYLANFLRETPPLLGGSKDRSRALLQKLAQASPDDLYLLVSQGMLDIRQERWDDAWDHFRQIVTKAEGKSLSYEDELKLSYAYIQLATLALERRDDAGTAVQYAEHHLATSPQPSPVAAWVLAQAYDQLQRYDKAVAAAQQAYEMADREGRTPLVEQAQEYLAAHRSRQAEADKQDS